MRSSTGKVTLFLFLALFCIVPFLTMIYISVNTQLDRQRCYDRISNVSGVEPTYQAIVKRINNTIKPGMIREEIETQLSNVGPYTMTDKNFNLGSGYSGDIITIGNCSIPANNISLHLTYFNGALNDFVIEKDD